jgi:hypothetical protein
MIAEHLLFSVKFILSIVIDDVPEEVEIQIARLGANLLNLIRTHTIILSCSILQESFHGWQSYR